MSDTGFPLGDLGNTPTKGDGISRGRLRRTAPLAALSARTAGEAVVVGLRGKLTGADSTEFHIRTAERYAELLGRSKGALMKAGQMLSLISAGPAVPEEFQSIYQVALTRLRDDAPPMAPELARSVLHAEGIDDGELGLAFVGSEEMRTLKRDHLGVDEPTDVLSFPIDGRDDVPAGVPRALGDVVICPQVVGDEWRWPLTHGLLHLLGYDHGDAMEQREKELL